MTHNKTVEDLIHKALLPLQTRLLALIAAREAIPIIDELDELDILVDSAIMYAEVLENGTQPL